MLKMMGWRPRNLTLLRLTDDGAVMRHEMIGNLALVFGSRQIAVQENVFGIRLSLLFFISSRMSRIGAWSAEWYGVEVLEWKLTMATVIVWIETNDTSIRHCRLE